MKKRILSILLCCVMLVGLLPTAAFAEGSAEEPPVCSCETACTAEAMNADCPICGVEGALPENCAKCSGPVEDAAAEPEVEDNEAQPEASPVVLSGKREIKSEAELNVALGDKSCTEITLGENIELSGGYIISHTVTLDLNGYTLTVNGDEWDIFSVYESGNLTVKDSGTGGKIDGQNKNCGFCIYGGVLTLESGTIINCMTDGDGSAVDISSGDSEGVYGKFVMNGGAITNCKATDDGGAVDIGKGCTFIMNSGTISGCRADDDAGAIFIKGNASFLMNGGTIENCSAGNYGGAVKIRNTSRFTMNGGTISSCTAQQGGGVYVDGSSTFTMNDGSIASCTAVNGGNSVFVVKPSASFTMTGGTVDGSIALPYKVGNNTVYMDGLGTAAYPYQISTADQLKLFRDIVNGAGGQTQNRGAYAVLTADIDLNNEPWTPIGPDRDSAYTGTFDGQGHTVRNLSVTVNVQPGRAGLFGCVKDGTIRKLTVAGSVSCTANQGWCGGIAGYAMDETIENCASLCTVSCTGIDARVGGIVGLVDYNSRTLIIRDCYNIGKITGRSDNGSGDAGGICGFYMNGKISNCYNVGEITGSGYVSKIAVSAYNDSRPTNCYYLSDTDTDLNGTAKTAAEFANGDVLEELKAGRNDSPWDSCQYVAAAKITLPVFKGQGDAHEHNGNWTSNGDGTHSRHCTCNVVETQNCSGGTATCTQRATCTVCGAEYGDVLGHDFTTSWTHDDNEHWKQCSLRAGQHADAHDRHHAAAVGAGVDCGDIFARDVLRRRRDDVALGMQGQKVKGNAGTQGGCPDEEKRLRRENGHHDAQHRKAGNGGGQGVAQQPFEEEGHQEGGRQRAHRLEGGDVAGRHGVVAALGHEGGQPAADRHAGPHRAGVEHGQRPHAASELGGHLDAFVNMPGGRGHVGMAEVKLGDGEDGKQAKHQGDAGKQPDDVSPASAHHGDEAGGELSSYFLNGTISPGFCQRSYRARASTFCAIKVVRPTSTRSIIVELYLFPPQ